MPHVIAEYSSGLSLDTAAMLKDLHASLAAQETIDPARIKTRGVRLDHYIVGEGGKEMVHITLKLMPRAPEAMKRMGVALQHIAMRHAPAASVTAEIVMLDPDTYCL